MRIDDLKPLDIDDKLWCEGHSNELKAFQPWSLTKIHSVLSQRYKFLSQ
jgi:hypothetical protein